VSLFRSSSLGRFQSLLSGYQLSSLIANTKYKSVAVAQSSRNHKAPLNWHEFEVTKIGQNTIRSFLVCLSFAFCFFFCFCFWCVSFYKIKTSKDQRIMPVILECSLAVYRVIFIFF
jgi:hypothetical protein